MSKEDVMRDLFEIRNVISPQTFRTIKGQIDKGDLQGASVGIGRIKQKMISKSAKN